MTPAVAMAKKSGIFFKTHQYSHDPSHESYGEEAAEKLAVDPARVFKTLVVSLDQQSLAVAVVPVTGRLDMKAVARILKQKKVGMAEADVVQRATGYVLGGVSPLGQKRRLPTLIDDSARNFETIYVSAGRRGLELELPADDLGRLVGAHFGTIARAS
ncbi:MAG: Cys-tRNA(Pro) deacylase [Candidatus Thiodiazotropha sp. (ex Myrtea sp. 'scaly one' KF741663)]|nr:Cys-tRNA(Pro) deacylase [Candidatus Thiodiazotropha sp. (ex Myrtea sp. 'scaly one' KF741663)]